MTKQSKVSCKYEYNRGIQEGVKQGKLETLEKLRALGIVNYSIPENVYFVITREGGIIVVEKGLN
jgi:hypothetical protein